MSRNMDIYQTEAEHALIEHTTLPGVATCQIGFGFDATPMTPLDFTGPAVQTPTRIPWGGAHPGFPADHPVPITGFIVGCAWVVTAPDPSNIFQLWKTVAATPAPFGLPLPVVGTNPQAYTPLAGYPVTAGEAVSLQWAAGTGPPPGLSSFVFFIVGA